MNHVPSQAEIQAMPKIKVWLDWMERVEDEIINRPREEIRDYILGGLLTEAGQKQIPLTREDFAQAEAKIKPVKFPSDFDLYGQRRTFYIPCVQFPRSNDFIGTMISYGFFLVGAHSRHINPTLFPEDRTSGITQLVIPDSRPVTTLIAPKRSIQDTLTVHAPFAVDPFSNERGSEKDEDRVLNKWVGILNLLNEDEKEEAIKELITERSAYYYLVHPKSGDVKPDEMGIGQSDLILYTDLDIKTRNDLLEKGTRYEALQKEEMEAFLARPFGEKLGFKPRGNRLQTTDLLITPIYNFLKKLLEELGYGKALTLLMRCQSLQNLEELLTTECAGIDFKSSSYQDIDLVYEVLNS